MRPHLDHGDVIVHKTCNNSFQQRLQSLQYKASSAITGVVKGSSTKVYQGLGLESLQNRWWFQKLCIIYKIVKENSPKYLFDLIPSNNNSYQTRNSQNLVIPQFFFFPSALVEWNKLDMDIRNSPLYSTFKNNVLNFSLKTS